jgi:hypothetical protein
LFITYFIYSLIRCVKTHALFLFDYFQILASFSNSDLTTSTTCTIFDDEAKGILKITVSELLDLLQGNDSEVSRVIQELYGKSFILVALGAPLHAIKIEF